MSIEFPYRLTVPDPEADVFIRDKILKGVTSEEAQFVAWYNYMALALPFPFEAYMKTGQTGTTISHRLTTLERMGEMDKCGPKQLWVYGKISVLPNDYFYFFLEEMSSILKNKKAYKPVYLWKYWLHLQRHTR